MLCSFWQLWQTEPIMDTCLKMWMFSPVYVRRLSSQIWPSEVRNVNEVRHASWACQNYQKVAVLSLAYFLFFCIISISISVSPPPTPPPWSLPLYPYLFRLLTEHHNLVGSTVFYIWEYPHSNLLLETSYPGRFSWFSSSLQAQAGIQFQIRLILLPHLSEFISHWSSHRPIMYCLSCWHHHDIKIT
jgi:hypothetical protein